MFLTNMNNNLFFKERIISTQFCYKTQIIAAILSVADIVTIYTDTTQGVIRVF
jgi:hypothetical protein